LDGFLNLCFLNLGGFAETVHLKKENLDIGVGVEVVRNGVQARYSVLLGKKESKLKVTTSKPFEVSLEFAVTFPYSANQSVGTAVEVASGVAQITWNGISPTVSVTTTARGEQIIGPQVRDLSGQVIREDELEGLSKAISAPIEELRGVDFVPLRRGFTKPNYSSVPMQQQLLTEDELATLLATEPDLEAKVANYLEKIVDRAFTVRPTIGTANFSLQSRDRTTGLLCDLVNEGFGTNQLVTILTKSLREQMHTICIEESEIHLHPTLMDKLVSVLVEITREEDKSFILSTHSEHIVLSLLKNVTHGKMKPEDLKLYYFSKKGRKASIEEQTVNEKGQIKGGLKGFFEAELQHVKDFFSIS